MLALFLSCCRNLPVCLLRHVMVRVSVCWSSPRQCDHFLSCVNGAGLPLGQAGETAMFYCNTCGKSPSPFTTLCRHTCCSSSVAFYFVSVMLLSLNPTNGMNLFFFCFHSQRKTVKYFLVKRLFQTAGGKHNRKGTLILKEKRLGLVFLWRKF